MTTTRTISFQELIPGSEGVRLTEDDLLWATDLTMAVTGKNRDDAGWVLRNLKSENFDPVKITETHLAANGGKKTKLVTFDHALELVMVLPGKIAKQFRVDACDILKLFFAGDQSLHEAIDRNAASDAPINAMARGEKPGSGSGMKRRYEELALQERLLSIKDKQVSHQRDIIMLYQSLCPSGVVDDRANLMFKDNLLNLLGSRPAIQNGPNPEGAPMTVSDMVMFMGLHYSTEDKKQIGLQVAAKFRDRYGPDASPGKHSQIVGGQNIQVNHYVAKDHYLLQDVISGYVPASNEERSIQTKMNKFWKRK